MCWKVGSVERGEGGQVPSSLFFSILGSYSNKIGFPYFLFSFVHFFVYFHSFHSCEMRETPDEHTSETTRGMNDDRLRF